MVVYLSLQHGVQHSCTSSVVKFSTISQLKAATRTRDAIMNRLQCTTATSHNCFNSHFPLSSVVSKTSPKVTLGDFWSSIVYTLTLVWNVPEKQLLLYHKKKTKYCLETWKPRGRSSHAVLLHSYSSCQPQHSFAFYGCTVYNKLPSAMRNNIVPLYTFKTHIFT